MTIFWRAWIGCGFKGKELEFLAGNDAALLLVDYQAKFIRQTRDRRHDPLGTAFRFREDREIIGVTHKRQTSSPVKARVASRR